MAAEDHLAVTSTGHVAENTGLRAGHLGLLASGTSRRSPSRFDPSVGRVIFVQPYGGVVLGRGVGVEPPIADLHDGSVADSAAFVHANSIGATGWCRPAERSDQGRPVPALPSLARRELEAPTPREMAIRPGSRA